MSVFGVIWSVFSRIRTAVQMRENMTVRMRGNFTVQMRKNKTRITPNTDTFYAVVLNMCLQNILKVILNTVSKVL